MTAEGRARLLGLSAVLLWSTVATAFKLGLDRLRPAQLLVWATVSSLVVLGLVLAIRGRLGLAFCARRNQYLVCAGLGLLNPFLYYTVLFSAYDRLPAQIAQPLNYTWALTLSWLSIPLLHHRFHRRDLLAGLICYAGVVIISTGGRLDGMAYDPLGIALALGSTVIWALYWIGNTRSDLDPVVGLFLGFLFALPLVIAYAMFTTGLSAGGIGGLSTAAYIGTFEMGLTYVLWLSALKSTRNASRVANLIFLSPFLSLVLIWLVLGESIRSSTPLGLVLIVAGLIAQRQSEARDQKP